MTCETSSRQHTFRALAILSLFKTGLMTGVCVAATVASAHADGPQAWAERYVSATGYEQMDAIAIDSAVSQAIPVPDGDFSVFLGTGIGPLAKAALALDLEEGPMPRARYRIQYGLEWASAPPPSDELVSHYFVQIDRFNLGPQIHEELTRIYGVDAVAPAEEFGHGPHVSWRLAMNEFRHLAASMSHASRRVINDATAAGLDCLGGGCLETSLDFDAMPESMGAEWRGMADSPYDIDPDYADLSNGLPVPAAVLDLLAVTHGIAENDDGAVIWRGGEPRESVAAGEPFMTIIMDVNLAQDQGIDLVMRDGHQMDDSIAAVWRRVATTGGAGGDAPMVLVDEAYEYRRPGDDVSQRSEMDTGPGPVVDPVGAGGGAGAPRQRSEHRPPNDLGVAESCADITTAAPGASILFPGLDGPGWLDAGPGPVTVEIVGCSNTFEGNLNYEAYHGDNSEPTLTGFTSGGSMGVWRDYSIEETFWTAGEWTVVVLEYSMETGEPMEFDRVTFFVD